MFLGLSPLQECKLCVSGTFLVECCALSVHRGGMQQVFYSLWVLDVRTVISDHYGITYGTSASLKQIAHGHMKKLVSSSHTFNQL